MKRNVFTTTKYDHFKLNFTQEIPGLQPHQCLYMCKYVSEKSSVAMLATKTSAGVALEVNLSNPLHTGNETHKRGECMGVISKTLEISSAVSL